MNFGALEKSIRVLEILGNYFLRKGTNPVNILNMMVCIFLGLFSNFNCIIV